MNDYVPKFECRGHIESVCKSIRERIPRGIIGLNYLSKFVCTQ